jgi:hypothetical protein
MHKPTHTTCKRGHIYANMNAQKPKATSMLAHGHTYTRYMFKNIEPNICMHTHTYIPGTCSYMSICPCRGRHVSLYVHNIYIYIYTHTHTHTQTHTHTCIHVNENMVCGISCSDISILIHTLTSCIEVIMENYCMGDFHAHVLAITRIFYQHRHQISGLGQCALVYTHAYHKICIHRANTKRSKMPLQHTWSAHTGNHSCLQCHRAARSLQQGSLHLCEKCKDTRTRPHLARFSERSDTHTGAKFSKKQPTADTTAMITKYTHRFLISWACCATGLSGSLNMSRSCPKIIVKSGKTDPTMQAQRHPKARKSLSHGGLPPKRGHGHQHDL